MAVVVADRLGRSMVRPVDDLAATADRMGSGDLDARVEVAGPPEVRRVGTAFNRLATQIGALLQVERETAADLSHRLRTPLTGARLNADALPDSDRKDQLVAQLDDIERVVASGHKGGAIVKVIFETALLTDAEKIIACEISRDAGAEFVKTSTGFGPGGATTDDVALMRRIVGEKLGVKASGGIGTREAAAQMIAAGATRIGASAGVRITRGL